VTSEETENAGFAVPLVWGTTEDMPILFANQFGIQIEAGTLLITIGQVAPPLFSGSEQDRIAAARDIERVEIEALVRLAVPVPRARQLRDLLDVMLTNYADHREQIEE
jgi:hypothetical protein